MLGKSTQNGCLMTGWWFGTMEFYDVPFIGNVISSQLTNNSIIFQRG